MNRSIQDYLSLGYIYLLMLGIIKDAVFYGFLDINILSYSNILDVLLSPLVFLIDSYKIPLIILGTIVFVYFYTLFIKKQVEKGRKKKIAEGKMGAEDPPNAFIRWFLNYAFLTMLVIVIFSLYLGAGVGGGKRTADLVKSGEYSMDHQLVFLDRDTLPVRLIGQNSQYVFYVKEGDRTVSIAPISGNIKSILKKEEKE